MGDLEVLRTELDRLAVSYERTGRGSYASLHDMGDGIVWLMGPPLSGLRWQGPIDEVLVLLRELPDDAGPVKFWHALDVEP